MWASVCVCVGIHWGNLCNVHAIQFLCYGSLFYVIAVTTYIIHFTGT